MIGRFNGVILPLAKAPAPWNMVHSFRVQPQSARTRPLQSPGCPPPPALSDRGQCPLSSADLTHKHWVNFVHDWTSSVSECRPVPVADHCLKSNQFKLISFLNCSHLIWVKPGRNLDVILFDPSILIISIITSSPQYWQSFRNNIV